MTRPLPDDATVYRVDLPWSRPPLNLNQRHHWAVARRLSVQVHSDVMMMARVERLPRDLGRVHVALHWVPSTRRRRDTDNPTPTLKNAIDALVHYGLVADDTADQVSSKCVIDPVVPARSGGSVTETFARCYLLITDLTGQPGEAA